MVAESKSTIIESFPNDIKLAKEYIYDNCGFQLTNPKLNSESAEYGACSFELDGKKIQHRLSKITPKKVGQFVTIWRRNQDGITEPFKYSDDVDFIIITSKCGNNIGQFIFPKSVLADKVIITSNGKEGKRGIRVYPPWENATSKQAEKTQSWQTKYFIIFRNDSSTCLEMAKRLLI